MKDRIHEQHYNNYETIDIDDAVGGHQISQRFIGLTNNS